MSAWPSQPDSLSPQPNGLNVSIRRIPRWALWLGCLVCVLVIEGLAVSQSYLWAAPLAGVLLVAVAVDIPLVPFLAVTLVVRVLTDDIGTGNSHHSGSLNLAGGIAVLIMLVAVGLLLRRQRGTLPTALAVLWLCIWTTIAIHTNGASSETIREGVREGSVVALAVIVYNARGVVTVPVATRLVQFAGFIPALVALYQLATHTGLNIAGHIRANGTFVHPNGAAIFFAIAAIASLWRYLDYGRHRSDVVLTTLFGAALIATFSIDGLLTMLVMLMAFGALRPGSLRVKLGSFAVAGLVALAFIATPLGAERLASETTTSVTTAEHGIPDSSLAWRLYKWKTLIPELERHPLFGQGLGTTITAEATAADRLTGGFDPHNEYLRYLVETGIVGFAVLFWGLCLLIRALVRRRRIPGTLDAGTLNAATLALVVIIGCLFNSLADNVLVDSTTCYAATLIIFAVLSSPGIPIRRAPTPRLDPRLA
jgi:O-antigen ligase